jgi:hypothetical protein
VYSSSNSIQRACAEMRISPAKMRSNFRYILTFFGDAAGVDLRHVSDEEVDLFVRRFAYLSSRGVHRGGLSWMESSDVDDVLNDAASQAVNELFVAKGEA